VYISLTDRISLICKLNSKKAAKRKVCFLLLATTVYPAQPVNYKQLDEAANTSDTSSGIKVPLLALRLHLHHHQVMLLWLRLAGGLRLLRHQG